METRNILTLTALAALLLVGLSLNSCSKEEMGGQVQAKSNQPQMTAGDQAVYHNIMNFKKKVDYIKENPDYKSGETTTIDSAVWYLDASVNFTHAYNFESFDDFFTDSVFVEIPVSNGEINIDDLSFAYFEMVDKIRDSIYSAVQVNDKQLYSSVVTLVKQENGTIFLNNTSTIGSKTIEPGTETPFDVNWEYGETNGTCDNNNINSDAIHEIADAINSYKSLYVVDQGEHWHAFYSKPDKEVEVDSHNEYMVLPGVELLLNPDDETLGDNDRDKLMFYQHVNGGLEECILADDMNFYYHGTHQVIYEIMPDNAANIPDWNGIQGLMFNDIKSSEGTFTGIPSAKIELYHTITVLYSTRYIVYDEGYPIPMQ